MLIKYFTWFSLFLLLYALTACGGGDTSGGGDGGVSPVTGTLLDGAVQGVTYQSTSLSGVTDASGQYQCLAGEIVSFSIGNLHLGAADCQPLITPIELTSSTQGADDVAVMNMARLLQSLDLDGDASNGLDIPATAATVTLEGVINFDLQAAEFEQQPDVQSLLLNVAGQTELRDSCQAELHIKSTLISEGVLDASTVLPVCNTVDASLKVKDGLQQAVAAGETSVNIQTQVLLDNFILGQDGRAEIYIDDVYSGLIETPDLDIALVPGEHEVSIHLVDLAGNPLSTQPESTLSISIDDNQPLGISLASDVLFLKPYQHFQVFTSGINLLDGEHITAQFGGVEIVLEAYNGVLMGSAPDLPANSHLLEMQLNGQPISLLVDFLREESIDPVVDSAAIVNQMQLQITQLSSTLDPIVDAAWLQSLDEMSQALDAELISIASMNTVDAQAYYLYLNANIQDSSLLPRSISDVYSCTEISNMAKAVIRFSLNASLTAGLATATTGGTALGGIPGVLAGAAGVFTFYQAVKSLEEFKLAFENSIACLTPSADNLSESGLAVRSVYRVRNVTGVINVQDGIQKSFVVKTTYLSDNPEYMDVIRKFNRALSRLRSITNVFPESWKAALNLPAEINLQDREATSDPTLYRVEVAVDSGITSSVTTSAGELHIEFASTIEQDFNFTLVNTQTAVETVYSAHITVDKPVASDAVLNVINFAAASGVLTSTDPVAIYQVVTQPLLGTVQLNEVTGEFSYTAASTTVSVANDIFTFKAISSRGVESDFASVTVSLTVARPIANNGTLEVVDLFTTKEGVLTSSDATATYQLVNWPLLGKITLNEVTGVYSYTPWGSTTPPASDSFTFKAITGRGVESGPATISVSIIDGFGVSKLTMETLTTTITVGDSVNLSVTALYTNGQTVPAYLINWDSSIDGSFGTGNNFNKNNLSVGTHKITARINDNGIEKFVNVIITVNDIVLTPVSLTVFCVIPYADNCFTSLSIGPGAPSGWVVAGVYVEPSSTTSSRIYIALPRSGPDSTKPFTFQQDNFRLEFYDSNRSILFSLVSQPYQFYTSEANDVLTSVAYYRFVWY